jgi:hypothetical protein
VGGGGSAHQCLRSQGHFKDQTLPAALPLLSAYTPDGGRRVPQGKALRVVAQMYVLEVESSPGLLRVAGVESNPGYVGWNKTQKRT